jgi:hypothetical protein
MLKHSQADPEEGMLRNQCVRSRVVGMQCAGGAADGHIPSHCETTTRRPPGKRRPTNSGDAQRQPAHGQHPSGHTSHGQESRDSVAMSASG